ncbi:MAG: murein L,D-transpeptidase family protein [Syntrophobacteraceae bacterium]
MRSFTNLDRNKGIVILALCVLVIWSLPSCSMFESQPRIRMPVTKLEVEVPKPEEPGRPYCEVNLDCPISEVWNPTIFVCKSERRLLLVQNKTLIRDYRIGLGPSPSGDKYFRGDGRTPEGEFYVCAKNPSSKYYKSLGLSYPTPNRAEEALQTGYITEEQYKKIVEANEKKKLPPPNTALGGAIFIHGGGTYDDWTLGCVAVKDSVMDELFKIVDVGTPVKILP